MSPRNTCMCITHANFNFILQKLFKSKVLSSPCYRNYIEQITCEFNSKSCMYRMCENCRNKTIQIPENPLEETFNYKWCQKNLDRKGAKGLTYHVKVTSKEAIKYSIQELFEILNNQTPKFLKHVYDTHHQFIFSKI